MRKLTIHRRSSFFSCFTKMKVYFEDRQNGDTLLNGIPCRLLGTIKNGESVSFDLPNEGGMLIVLPSKRVASMASEILMLPPGEQDIILNGVATVGPLFNAFRFDYIQAPETLANRKKCRRKSLLPGLGITLLLAVIGLFMGYSIALDLWRSNEPITYSEEGISITLPGRFRPYEVETENFDLCYYNRSLMTSVMVTVMDGENKSNLLLYAMLVENSLSQHENTVINKQTATEDGLLYFEFTVESDSQTHCYARYFYASSDYWYCVTFGAREKDFEKVRDDVTQWARSVTVE